MKLWACAGVLFIAAGCNKAHDAASDAMAAVEAGPPARLVWTGGAWAYDRDVPKRATIQFDNETKEPATIRLATGETIKVIAGPVRLSVPATSFAFDRVHPDGRAEPMGPFALAEGTTYVCNLDALAIYEMKAQRYSNLGVPLGGDPGPPQRIAGAAFFAVKADFVLAPFPDQIPTKKDEIVGVRTALQVVEIGTPKCTTSRGDGGGFTNVCGVGAGEWTVQVRGEGEAPTATVWVDNAYSDAIELRVDQVPVATLEHGSLTRVHVSPKSHVLGAYGTGGARRDETTQTLGEWKNYVWTPEKRRSFIVEKRDYGVSLGPPPLLASNGPERLAAPGFFETDADYLFAPFPETVQVGAYSVGTTRKRLSRVGAKDP